MKSLLALVLCLIGNLLTGAPASVPQKTGDFASEAEAKEWLGIVAKLNRQERAFSQANHEYLLAEANNVSVKLSLATSHPLTLSDIVMQWMPPPSYCLIKNTNYVTPLIQTRQGWLNAQGRIETTNYSFTLQMGKLVNIQRIKQAIIYDGFEYDSRFVDTNIPALKMSANEAYQIATQWLAAIDMDVDSLEKKYGSRLKIEQRFYLALANEVKDELLNRPNYARDYSLSATNKVRLPIWQVMWPGGAEVQVLGFSKELIKLECLDPSLSRRKPLIFPNVAEIEKYSALKTNLPVLHLERPIFNETN